MARGSPVGHRRGLPVNPIIRALVERRVAKGLSQDKVAKGTGYAASAIQAWEVERRRPSFTALVDWANFLGYDISLQPRA